jgi:DNA polymerase I
VVESDMHASVATEPAWAAVVAQTKPVKGGCETCGLLVEEIKQCYAHLPAGCKIALIDESPRPGEVQAFGMMPGGRYNMMGQLVRMIMADLKADEKDVGMAYAVACPVPKGKKPSLTQMRMCWPSLVEELLEIKPTVLVPMGRLVTQMLLGMGPPIRKRRGIYKQGILPTIRPGAVLMDPLDFPDLRHDIDLALKIADGYEPVVEPPYENYAEVEDIDRFMDTLALQTMVAIDLETDGLDFLNGTIKVIGFSFEDETAWSIRWERLTPKQLQMLSLVLSSLPCTFQNGQFDVAWLRHRGIEVDYRWDTMLAHFLLDERKYGHDLESLAVRYCEAPDWKTQFLISHGSQFDEEETDEQKAALDIYNGADVDYTYRLTRILHAEHEKEGLADCMKTIIMPAANHFTELRIQGMLVDQALLREQTSRLEQEVQIIADDLHSFAGAADLNLNSPVQMATYLYDTLGLIPFGGPYDHFVRNIPEDVVQRCTATVDDKEAQEYWRSKRAAIIKDEEKDGLDSRSTTAYMLWWLAQQHDFPRMFLKYRDHIKRLSYCGRIWENLDPDSRVRPQYWLSESKTGRLSTTNPAIHNLPRGGEIFKVFVADPGWSIIYADYSQMELRVAAHVSEDKHFTKMLSNAEVDVHTQAALTLWGMTLEQYRELDHDDQVEKRRAAKAVNFGVLYGRTAKGLAPQLGVPIQQAQGFIDDYFQALPQLRMWIKRQQQFAMTNHYVTSLFGRRRRFTFLKDQTHEREVQRQAVNMPIQSAASDICLLAHMNSVKRLREEGIPARVWPHIHDSISIQVPTHLLAPALEIVQETMKTMPFPTKVPFDAEFKVGRTWGDLEKA